MPGHLATAALATLAAAAPAHAAPAHAARAHAARAHVRAVRGVAAGSSFGQPPSTRAPAPRPAPAHAHARARTRQDLHIAAARPRAATRRRTAARRHPLAHGAGGDPAVTISDFHFAAATTTVHVGDTITWTNDGPSAHTATATNGSFDTGTLNRGQSASHTFTQAGTYSYICTIHPFMHGTIVVLAAATSSTPQTTTAPSTTSSTPTTSAPAPASASGSPTATTTTTASAATARPSLPNTGIDVLSAVAIGGILFTAGMALRRAVRP